jgi:hypothetical protein
VAIARQASRQRTPALYAHSPTPNVAISSQNLFPMGSLWRIFVFLEHESAQISSNRHMVLLFVNNLVKKHNSIFIAMIP